MAPNVVTMDYLAGRGRALRHFWFNLPSKVHAVEPDTRQTINVLQAGRAVAALAVVFHHSAIAARNFGQPFAGFEFLRAGYLGVDFFFVLSGFIIYHSTVGRERTIQDYTLARLRRVFLPYLPVGVGIAILYTLLPQMTAGDRVWSWLPTLTLLPVKAEPALSVAWTLKHEMLFYLAFGLLYFGKLLWVGLAIWALAITFGTHDNVPLALINLEFLMGIVAAWLYRRDIGHPALLLLAALLPLVWAALGALQEHSVLIGFGCAVAILELARLERQRRLQVPEWLTFLGAASYSLYLVHALTISAVVRVVYPSWLMILVAGVLASLAAGIGYYWFVERRLLSLVDEVISFNRSPLKVRPGP